MLTWHHVTGAFNPEAYIHRLVVGIVQLSACPDLQVYFNMVPVDFAAEAISATLQDADKRNGAVLNIVRDLVYVCVCMLAFRHLYSF